MLSLREFLVVISFWTHLSLIGVTLIRHSEANAQI